MAVKYQIKGGNGAAVTDWVDDDSFHEVLSTNQTHYGSATFNLTGVTDAPPIEVLRGVTFGTAYEVPLKFNFPVEANAVHRIQTYHYLPDGAVGASPYNIDVKCDEVSKATISRISNSNKIFQTDFLYKTIDSVLDLDFVPPAGFYCGFSAIRISEVLKAKFSISNTNPKVGETVTITSGVVAETAGASVQWTLNGLPYSTEINPPALTGLSGGTKTLAVTVTDSLGNSVTYSRSFFVGEIIGANAVQRGATTQFATNITNPKWSIGNPKNHAEYANGGSVTTNSTASQSNYPVANVINGLRKYNSAIPNNKSLTMISINEYIEITFSSPQTIGVVDIFGINTVETEKSDMSVGGWYTITAGKIEAFVGGVWTLVHTYTGNDLIRKRCVFNSVTTQKIRYTPTASLTDSNCRITEIEVYGPVNLVDTDGRVWGNKIETSTLTAQEEFWSTQTGARSNPDNSAIITAGSGQVVSIPLLSGIGDFVRYVIPSNFANFAFQVGGQTGLSVTNGNVFDSRANTNTAISTPVGATLEFEIIDSAKNVKVKINGSTVYTTTLPPMNYGAPIATYVNFSGIITATSIPKPVYSSSTAPEKLVTKQVPVYEPAVANFAIPSEPVTGEQFSVTNTSSGTIASRLWELDDEPVSTDAAIELNLLQGDHKLKLTVFDGYGGSHSKTVTFYVYHKPPKIVDSSPLPYARIGYAYSHQFHVEGGSGSGVFSLQVPGTLPPNAVNNAGLLNISTAGNADYNFILKWTDGDGRTFSKAFSIPVSDMAFISFLAKRPLDITFIETYSYFEPFEGQEDVAEDAPLRRVFNINSRYVSKINRAELWAFLYEHRLRKKFMWHNADWNETLIVKVVRISSEKQLRSTGEFEFVLEEVINAV